MTPVPPTTTNEPLDFRSAAQLRVAENHDDILVDAAFDGRVAADDHDLTDGLSSLEVKVLEHPHGRIGKFDVGGRRSPAHGRRCRPAAGQEVRSKRVFIVVRPFQGARSSTPGRRLRRRHPSAARPGECREERGSMRALHTTRLASVAATTVGGAGGRLQLQTA